MYLIDLYTFFFTGLSK